MITTTIEWFDPREKLPEEDGYYLVYINNFIPVTWFCFAVKLSDIESIDFPQDSYFHHGGFVDFDQSEGRWYTVPLEEIKYWAKMPKIKEETKDD